MYAILLLLSVASVASATVAVPHTPAGRVLSAFLDAFNSGDRARIAAHLKKYQPNRVDLIDHILDVRRDTGGFVLVRIEHAEALAIDFVINAKAGPTTWLGHLEVTDANPPRVVELRREEIPRGMSVAQMLAVLRVALAACERDGRREQEEPLSVVGSPTG